MYLISQPENRISDFINKNLTSFEFSSFTFCVAYAKRSGVDILRESIVKFKKGGGKIVGVVGIDQRNTSIEALNELLQLCDSLYVFHCEDLSQTYHPKVYFFDQIDKAASLITGSGNLTNGGLLNNFEVSLFLSLDYTNESDKKLIDQTKSIIQSYIDKGDLCMLMTPELLRKLVENNYILSEEKLQLKQREVEKTEFEKTEKLFGRGSGMIRTRTSRIDKEPSRTEEISLDELNDGSVEEEYNLNTGFWKKLSRNDVSKTSSPGQIIIPAEYKSYFPPFINQKNMPAGGQQEESFMNIKFIHPDLSETTVNNARAIFYSPAPDHPRQNKELRFTFLNNDIFQSLHQDDILVFQKSQQPGVHFTIRHINSNMPEYRIFDGRYKHLP